MGLGGSPMAAADMLGASMAQSSYSLKKLRTVVNKWPADAACYLRCSANTPSPLLRSAKRLRGSPSVAPTPTAAERSVPNARSPLQSVMLERLLEGGDEALSR